MRSADLFCEALKLDVENKEIEKVFWYCIHNLGLSYDLLKALTR